MKFHELVDSFKEPGKRYLVLTVTPKGHFPSKFDSKNLENHILATPNEYTFIYDEGKSEIMHETAFRLFMLPLIRDEYDMVDRKEVFKKRLNEEEILNYFAIKNCYNVVRSGVEIFNEKESIEKGKDIGQEMLTKYPISQYEYGFITISRNIEEINLFQKLNFKNSEDYYFDYIYAN